MNGDEAKVAFNDNSVFIEFGENALKGSVLIAINAWLKRKAV